MDADADAGEVGVSLGYPVRGPARRQIWICTDIDAEYSRYASGGATRNESGTLLVRCLVTVASAEAIDPRDGALVLVGYVEEALATYPTLSGTVDFARASRLKGQEALPEERQRQYGAELTISYSGGAALG